jgi:hypothetical protein
METGDWKQETGSANALVTRHPSPVTPRDVLLLDLAHTDAQLDERYSSPSPIPGKLPVKYPFASKLNRAAFGELEIPEEFAGNRARYLLHSLNLAIEETAATVIIIDDLAWFDTKASGPTTTARTLRDLKLFCLKTGASVLVLHTTPPQTLRIPHSALRTYQAADSVFAIARSPFMPEMRYVKQFKSTLEITHGASNVLCYAIERTAGFAGQAIDNGQLKMENARSVSGNSPLSIINSQLNSGSPPYEGGVASAADDGVVLSQRPTQHEPQGQTSFLGLTHAGLSKESDHYRDYAAEALAKEQAHERQLKRLARRSSKTVLLDGMIDGSYLRYLKGE